jgi:type I restriction enzyme, R subunit
MPEGTPEEKAREQIDKMLAACGWVIQSKASINLSAARGVAICELTFATGEPDYTLFVDGKAIGTVEAKPEGDTLTGVEEQSAKYVAGVPFGLPAWKTPLPFCYESTGKETFFTNRLDPVPRSRRVFSFHRPETLLAWVQQVVGGGSPLAQRLREFPALPPAKLWPAQIQAITNLEKSFAAGRPRALIQMATGSGKTYTAVNFIYRLVKYAGARRVLFLVDRGNLGQQTLNEFQQFVSPVNNYKFTEEYIVQHLSSNSLDTSARVVIGTIQRIYSMLKGETAPAPDLDDLSIEAAETLFKRPVPAEYNPAFPIEEFDFIITDECHRSIYNLWRQVLEYFDASLIGLKPHSSVTPKYLNVALNSDPVRKRTKGMVHGVGRPRLNLGEIKSIALPLPPLIEQMRIVAEVERRLNVVEELESVVSVNLQRATRLRQCILQKAFTGNL